jgi:hypothetical protein
MFDQPLPRLTNTIRFKDSFSKEWCEINIIIKEHKQSGFYEITYVSVYSSTNNENARNAHPLYQTSIRYDDESLLEGIYIAANPITYHILTCIMSQGKERKSYNTGLRIYEDYCAELMRSLAEIES